MRNETKETDTNKKATKDKRKRTRSQRKVDSRRSVQQKTLWGVSPQLSVQY